MTGALISLICTDPIYSAACRNIIEASGRQSGFYSFLDTKKKEFNNFIELSDELKYVSVIGAAAFRFNNNRMIRYRIKNVNLFESISVGASKNTYQIEFRWGL